MTPAEIIALVVIGLLVGGAVAYIIRAKKRGQKCIGCPYSGQCPSQQNNCSGCQNHCGKSDK